MGTISFSATLVVIGLAVALNAYRTVSTPAVRMPSPLILLPGELSRLTAFRSEDESDHTDGAGGRETDAASEPDVERFDRATPEADTDAQTETGADVETPAEPPSLDRATADPTRGEGMDVGMSDDEDEGSRPGAPVNPSESAGLADQMSDTEEEEPGGDEPDSERKTEDDWPEEWIGGDELDRE